MNRRAVRELRDARRRTARRATALATAGVVLVALVLYGAPVPRLSEELYLPLTRHVGDPSFLAGDWTMRGAFGEHWVFTHLFGPIAAAVPLTRLRVGRPARRRGPCSRGCSSDSVAASDSRRCGAAAGIVLWLVANQALIGGDWMFGTFEAKTVADILVVGAHPRRDRRAGRARGRAARARASRCTRDSAAGRRSRAAPRSLANPTTRATGPCAGRRSGCCSPLPGLVAVLSSVGASDTLDRFLVIVALPYHLDPFFGGTELAGPQVILRAAAVAPRCSR